MRRTMRSRLSIGFTGLRPGGSLFNALLVRDTLNDAFYEDAWRVNGIRLERSRGDQLLHLRDRVPRGGGHHRIEVARGLSKHEIAHAIALPGLDEREIGMERRLEDVGA